MKESGLRYASLKQSWRKTFNTVYSLFRTGTYQYKGGLLVRDKHSLGYSILF